MGDGKPSAPPHLPVLRAGVEYESLDVQELAGFRGGEPLARIGRANAGLIRRDLARGAAAAERLRAIPAGELARRCQDAARRFLEDALPLNDRGDAQSPEDYVRALSATSGLPHALVRANMRKVATVLGEIERVLAGLTRGLDLATLDGGFGEQAGTPVCFTPQASALGVVLPSNSPGVNSIWIPALALKTPVVLKPGREEPWTPLRIVRALIEAGFPREAFSFYPTDHDGAAAILELAGRALLFGDEKTTKPWAADPRVQIHGPGWSKVLLGPDEAPRFAEHLDALAASVADNSGRSCINASTILTPSHAAELADALARRLAPIAPRAPEDPEARLCAFPNPEVAAAIDAAIERGLAAGGAEDVTARYRRGPRRVEHGGATYLLPTILACDSIEHPLARTEYLFPFASVVQVPAERLPEALGPSLAVTAITRDEGLRRRLLASRSIERLNLGPLPTSRVEWDQPHEGNLFEFLYRRRAIQRAAEW